MLPADDKQRVLELLRHASYLLDSHPRLSAQQLLEEMQRARSTVQHVIEIVEKVGDRS